MTKGKNLIATSAKKILNTVLKVDANSASCLFAYQPKPPETLSRLKKRK